MSRRKHGRVRRSQGEWRELIAERRQVGESVEAFCGSRGLEPRTFRWWSWKLRDEVVREPREVPSRWVELRLDRREEEENAGFGAAFEVCFSGGVRLRVPEQFDAVALERLVSLLRAATC